ncbi:hypothetical protein ACIXIY_16885 [Bacteroides fragilis]|jgi:hypothetical protein
MKKILFNDKYELTQAVLDGRKTMTRRAITCPRTFRSKWVAGFNVHIQQSDRKIVDYPCMYDADEREFDGGQILPKYKVGEVVAIAQCYMDIDQFHRNIKNAAYLELLPGLKLYPGWGNKMFVRSDLMLHHIRITNIKVERLQDISDEDCLKEGVVQKFDADGTPRYYVSWCKHTWAYATDSAKDAYHFLIDKVSGKGIWESNPYVWVYEFELVD